jgi:8-oxo-dGTP diphosphatase
MVERIYLDEGFHYVILDYHVTVTGGSLRPGSDVTDARWVLPSEMTRLELSDGLLEALRDFGLRL